MKRDLYDTAVELLDRLSAAYQTGPATLAQVTREVISEWDDISNREPDTSCHCGHPDCGAC